MFKNFIVLLSAFFLIYACEKKTKVKIVQPIETVEEISAPNSIIYLNSSKTEDEILAHLEKRTIEIVSILDKSTPENANKIYENLKKENDSLLILLSTKQQQLLDKYVEYSDYDPTTEIYSKKFPPEIKKTIKRFEKLGIEFWEIGEGYTELRMLPNFYFKIFNGKLTPDYQLYLETIAKEDENLFLADAGIIIPWRDVAKRIEVREHFLQEFRSSELIKTVQTELQDYQYAYLIGYDNTPTSEEGKFYPEILTEFKRFIKENPNSKTTKIIKEITNVNFKNDQMSEFVMDKIGYSLY